MARDIWDGFNPHSQLLPIGSRTGENIPFYSHFTTEQRIQVGRVLKILQDLATPTNEFHSALTTRIVNRFNETIDNDHVPSFTNIVFMSILDLYSYTVQEHSELASATRCMLEAAGAEGTGAVVNATTDYLRTTYSGYQQNTENQYYVVNKEIFTRPHRIISIDPWEEHWVEIIDVEPDKANEYFRVHCLGEVFSNRIQESVADAATLLIFDSNNGISDVLQIVSKHEKYILGPAESPEIFKDRWGMLQRVLLHIRSLTPEIIIPEDN